MLNVVATQDAILAHLKNTIPQPVYEVSIPDINTVIRDSTGAIPPYVAIQFGDPQAIARGRGFSGVRNDDYELPIYVQAIAPEARIARVIAYDKVLDALLGYGALHGGEVRKRPGGGMWPIRSGQVIEAYMVPASFAVSIQMS